MAETLGDKSKCCFELRRYIGDEKEEWREGCQFTEDAPLDDFEVDGKHYCLFHAPLADRFGKPTDKNEKVKDAHFLDAFKQKIEQQLNPRIFYRSGMRADLCGVVFPPGFNLIYEALPVKRRRAFNAEPTIKHVFPILLAEGARFSGDTDLSKADFPAGTSFKGVEFNGGVDFTGSKFGGGCDFTNTVFHIAPNFHGAHLDQPCTISKAKFKDWKTTEADGAYRILKTFMEKVCDWNGMAKFHALEERSARHQRKLFDPIRFASAVYDMASKYGQSFVRPLWGLVFTAMAAFALYWGAYLACNGPWEWSVFREIGAFGLKQMVKPFDAIVSGVSVTGLGPWGRFFFGAVAFIQTLFTAGFVTLFILAVRRRFRMA